MRKQPKKYDIVEIIWLDAVGHDDTWKDPDERLTEDDSLHKSTGYFIDSNDKFTHICRSYRPDDGTMEAIFAIPTGCIQSIRVIKKACDIPKQTE